ncbi:MAG: glycine/sarcosine/betaine reductase selenoprotein B family protein [Dehalococcoidia bacterium]
MPRLEDLSEVARQGHLNFPCYEFESSPVTALAKPLTQSRMALVTTAGLHVRWDKPFASGDQSYRVIPADTQAADIIMSHTSIGFDRTSFYRDINVTFPVDRFRELAERGVVGSLASHYYSFMGAHRDPRKIVEETGPEVARLLREDGVEAVFLTPT